MTRFSISSSVIGRGTWREQEISFLIFWHHDMEKHLYHKLLAAHETKEWTDMIANAAK